MKHCAINKPKLRTIPIYLLAAFAAVPLAPIFAQEKVLDLTAPANYSQQAIPGYITKVLKLKHIGAPDLIKVLEPMVTTHFLTDVGVTSALSRAKSNPPDQVVTQHR